MTAHRLTGVYAITDDLLLPGKRLLTAVEQALQGGVSVVQYRSKAQGKEPRAVAECRQQASALVHLCHQYNALLLINDDIELCRAVAADGVHLGQGDTPLSEARQRLGPTAVIGVTCHDRDELVHEAEQQGADYVALGRFFPSVTKPHAPAATLDDLQRIRRQTALPIVAIGGVNACNGGKLIAAGADMLAVIHYLFSDNDVQLRAAALSRLFTPELSTPARSH